MKRYLSIIAQIFPWYLREIFVNRFAVPAPIPLPTQYKSYKLLKSLSLKGFPFATGLYQDNFKQQVVIKFWEGKTKNIYYFNLLHQIEVMQVLTKAQNRLAKSERFGFSLPKYIDSYKSKNRIILVMEKVIGKPLENITSPKSQFTIYKSCLNFLSALSARLNSKEKEIVTTKSVWDFLLLYPFVLLTALIVQPKLLGLLLRGTPAFILGIPSLLKLTPDTLVHGDIHPDNILVSDRNKFSLIDVENMRLCYAIYEPVSTVSLKGNSKEFKKLVIKHYLKTSTSLKAMVLLIVNNATHNLSGDKNPAGIASYKQALNLAFKI